MDPIEEQSIEEKKWYQGPLKIIVGLFLLLIIVVMVVPYYGIKLDPHPTNVNVVLDFVDDEYSRLENINVIKNLQLMPTIRNNAVKITSARCESNIVCNAKALFYFTRDEIDYIPDPSREYIQHPIETLKSTGGDCEDKAILLGNMLTAVGFKTRLVLTYDHAYTEVWVPDAMQKYKSENSWIALDPSCAYCEFGQIPPKYAEVSKKYVFFG